MCLPFHNTGMEYCMHRLLHHLEQDFQSNPKSSFVTLKIVPHPSRMLTSISQDNVLEIFEDG